ncbi:hypothetical protein RGQ29_021995 [Quercus rubra]|uniref:2-deoxyglucose-6-phosphate phosphatase n=1 Tax=Quercus rubra TaxID=3512 RepID=A0AAN7IJN8_QUERU|nr:hypothetical protein RGQ29_021995 [Quercus rubra]
MKSFVEAGRVTKRLFGIVEDSVIGLQAATRGGMSCVISYTSSTAEQDFKDAIAIYPDSSNLRLKDLELLLQKVVPDS